MEGDPTSSRWHGSPGFVAGGRAVLTAPNAKGNEFGEHYSGAIEIAAISAAHQSIANARVARIDYPGDDNIDPLWDCESPFFEWYGQLQTRPSRSLLADGRAALCVGAGGRGLYSGGPYDDGSEGGVRIYALDELDGEIRPEDATAGILGWGGCSGLGWRFATNVDLTGDGQDDIAVSINNVLPGLGAEIRVFEGPIDGLLEHDAHVAVIHEDEDRNGLANVLLEAMDLDGDGIGDLIATAYRDYADGPYANDYLAYVFLGPIEGELGLGDADLVLESPGPGRPRLRAADPLGDLDGDGHADFALTWSGAETGYLVRGTVCLYYGPHAWSGAMPEPGGCIEAYPGDANFGVDLAGGVDFNQDGYDDFAVTAPDVETESGQGAVYIFYGAPRN